MLYERYANKIKRLAAIRDIILKFKFVIIGVLIANFTLAVCFLATQGMILGGIKGETVYTYGSDVEYTSSALFAPRPSMEYSSDCGETWVDEAPVMPGEYKVRAVTHRMFFITQRSEPVDFVIGKKDLVLTVKDIEVEWRETPSVGADGLVRGDTLSFVQVAVDSTSIGDVPADIIESTACITSTDGVDVTSAYNITAEDGNVNVTARHITLKANDVTKVYDGAPASANGYTLVDSAILEGQTLDVSFDPLVKAGVGIEAVKISDVKITEGDADVTQFYQIVKQDGSADITKRAVSIVADSVEKVYDGERLSLPALALTDADGDNVLPAGDEWDIKLFEGELIDPQEIVEYVKYAGVRNGESDVSSNYDVTLVNGSAKITKRPITLTPSDVYKTYDGNAFTSYFLAPVADGALVLGDSVEVEFNTPTLRDAGIEDITISEVTIKGLRGDVTHCYEITTGSATANIAPRPITVTMQSFEKVYDGSIFSLTEGTHYTVEGEFVLDHGFAVNFVTPEDYIGVCKNKPYDVEYYLTVGGVKNTDIDKNYELTFINEAGVTVTSRVIEVTANDITGLVYSARDYDITQFLGNQITYVASLGDGYEFTVAFTAEKYRNAGTYEYTLDCHVWLNGVDVSENFEINIKYTGEGSSKIVIDPYEVKITLKDVTKDYDANAVVEENCVEVNKALLNGDMLVIGGFVDCVNVNRDKDGTVIAYVLPITYSFELTEGSIEGNYKVIYENGKTDVEITINPVDVTITLNDVEKTYDGKVVEYADCIETEKLIGDDTLVINGFTECVNVNRDADGTVIPHTLNISHSFKLAEGSIAGNYNVIYADEKHDVKITINPVDITVTLKDVEKTYDGKVVEYADCIETEKLIGDDTLVINGFTECVNVNRDADGTVIPHTLNISHSFKLAEGSIAGNYNVIYAEEKHDVKITIKPIDVTITLSDVEKTYDAVAVVENNCVDVNKTLIGNDKLVINGFTECVNVNRDADGSVIPHTLNITHDFTLAEGSIAGNYEVTYESIRNDQTARVLINPFDVTIALKDVTKTYNAEAVVEEDCVTVNKTLVAGDMLVINGFVNCVNVNRDADGNVIPHTLNITHGFTLIGDSIAGNYNVIYVDEKHDVKITINPVDVTITLNDVEKTYNAEAVVESDCVTVNKTLVAGDMLVINGFTECVNVNRDADGSVIPHTLNITHDFTLAEGSIAGNYEVTYESIRNDQTARVLINPFDVTIALKDVTKTYNAEAVVEEDCVTVNKTLVAGDMLVINGFVNCVNVNRDADGNVIPHTLNITHGFTLIGDSIAGNYNVIYVDEKHDVKITINPHKVWVTLNNVTKTYDGVAVAQNECINITELVGDDELLITGFENCVNAGTYNLTIGHGFDLVGDSIADNYDVIYNTHNITITINPHTVWVNLNNVTKTYNGVAVAQSECISISALVGGDTLIITGFESCVDAGTYNLTIGHEFSEGAIAGNYDVIYNTHNIRITINPRTVTIALKNVEMIYNSEAVAEGECITISGFVGPGKIEITGFKDDCINAGDYSFTVGHKFTNGAKAGNFNVVYENGNLVSIKIIPYGVIIELKDITKTYDGAAVAEEDCVLTTKKLYGSDELVIYGFTDCKNVLLDGSGNAIAYVLDISHEITVGDGSELGNYVVSYKDGKTKVNILINPYEVTVTLKNATKTYDGLAVLRSDCGALDQDLVGGDRLVITGFKDDCINAGDYSFTVGHEFDLKGDSIADNYKVNYTSNKRTITIKINPRTVTITLSDVTKTYDGESVVVDDFATIRNLVGDDKIVINGFTDCTNVKRDADGNVIAYTFDITHGFDLSEGSVEGNYKVTYASNKRSVNVLINPYEVTITLKDVEKTYDAEAVVEEDCVTVNKALVKGDMLVINGFTECVNVNRDADGNVIPHTLNITHGFTLVGGSIEGNYKVTYASNKHSVNVLINPYEVTITLKDVEKTYDAEAVVEEDCVTVDKVLVAGDMLVINGFVNCTNVKRDADGNVIAYVLPITCSFELEGDSIEGNYKVIYKNGKTDVNVLINPYEVTITLKDVEKTYDAEAVVEEDCVTVNKTLVKGDMLVINEAINFVNVKRDADGNVIAYVLPITYSFTLEGDSIEGNYNVIYEDGKTEVNVKINPVVVQIVTDDYTKMYDGKAVDFTTIIKTATVNLASGAKIYNNASQLTLVGEDTLTLGFGDNATYVDVLRYEGETGYYGYKYTVAWTFTAEEAGNYDIVVQYTDVAAEGSTITIVPVSVQIYAYDYEKMYDGGYVNVNDSTITNIFVSGGYSDGLYQSYGEVFVDDAAANILYYYIDADVNDKISIFFADGEQYKNVLRDADGNVIGYMYKVAYEVEELKDTTVTDRIIDNYDVTVIYTSSTTEQDANGEEYTEYFSTITITPVVVSIDAYDYSKLYDDVAITTTTDGILSDMLVDSLVVNGEYTSVQVKRAVINGEMQTYYELVRYTAGGEEIVEKMILKFVDIDTNLVMDKFVDVKRNANGEAIAYRYNIVGEMLDGELMSNYDLIVYYTQYEYDEETEESTQYSCVSISPRTVYVTTESEEFVFDGEAHSYPHGKIEAGKDNDRDGVLDDGLLSHHSKKEADGEWINYLEIVNVGTKLNTVGFTVIETENGIDKTANYDIVCVGGTLTVEPYTVSLKASGSNVEYTDKANKNVSVRSYSKVQLIEGDKILLARAATNLIYAGEGTTYVSHVVIKTRYGYEIYTFGGEPGETATVRTYQREDANAAMRIVVAYGQYIVISTSDEVTYYTYDPDKEAVYDENAILCVDTDEESYSYYQFDNVDGKAIVSKRKVVIECSSETAEHGPITGTAWISREDNTLDGHYLYFVTSGEATEKGVPVINTVRLEDIRIYSSAEMTEDTLLSDAVKDSYEFVIIEGTLLIE